MFRSMDKFKRVFFELFAKVENFKHEISKMQQYVCIKVALEEPLTEACMSFCAFVAHEFESFLLPFESKELMIHLLYSSMCKLLSKCIKNKVFIKRILREHRFRQERKRKTLKFD